MFIQLTTMSAGSYFRPIGSLGLIGFKSLNVIVSLYTDKLSTGDFSWFPWTPWETSFAGKYVIHV